VFLDYLEKGLAIGGWMIGFLSSLGLFCIVVYVLGGALTYVFGEKEDK